MKGKPLVPEPDVLAAVKALLEARKQERTKKKTEWGNGGEVEILISEANKRRAARVALLDTASLSLAEVQTIVPADVPIE